MSGPVGGAGPHGGPPGGTDVPASADARPRRLLRVLAAGALVGLTSSVVVEAVLERLVRGAVEEGVDPGLGLLLAILLVGPVVLVVVVVATVLCTSVAAGVALRLLRVPRALLVAGLSGAALAVGAVALLYAGVPDLQVWWWTPLSAAVHLGVWAAVAGHGR